MPITPENILDLARDDLAIAARALDDLPSESDRITEADIALIAATLAVAEEQRTANLLALITLGDLTHIPGVNVEVYGQIVDRLGVTLRRGEGTTR